MLVFSANLLYRSNFIFNPQRSMKKIVKKSNSQEQKLTSGMSQQNFKIYLRVKPSQIQDANSHIIKILNQNRVEITSPYYTANEIEKIYSYQEVFDDTFNNCKVFQQTMINPITNVLQGFNSTVFIYGMTGSGKTYTMFGSIGNGTSTGLKNQQDGLVSMTIDYMFNQIQKQSHIKSQIIVSFYQIYNENIRDLLQEEQQPLTIMEDPIKGVFINGLVETVAEQKNQIKDVIVSGIQRRAMNATRSNEVSSRSHAILQFVVKRYINSSESETSVLESKFFMIDLAGNQKTSNNQSRRFIQGININKSLLTLGKCLSILAERKAAFVPFRDSKLTRILKESLGGNSKTVMIACVSSQKRFYEQTLNTLKYSSVAKKIKNKGVKNNIKMISKQQIPDQKNFITSKPQFHHHVMNQTEIRIKKILGVFLNSVEAKFKIQKLQQDLEISRKQNEDLLCSNQGDQQICKKNIKKINQTLHQLLRPYQRQLQKVDQAYSQLMENIYQILRQKKKDKQNCSNNSNFNHSLQVAHLKQIISQQNKKIQDYQQRMHSNSIVCHLQQDDMQNTANKSLECRRQLSSINSPTMFKQNSVPVLNINPNSNKMIQRSQSKGKKLTLNIVDTHEDTFRSSGVNQFNSSNRSDQSLLEKRNVGYNYNGNKLQRQIIINLNNDKRGHESSKDEFVKRLKETEKKVKGVQSQQINSLLKEHQVKKYQLGNVEMSMIRKLRFFQRQKSLQKSNSLTKLMARTNEPSKFGGRKY